MTFQLKTSTYDTETNRYNAVTETRGVGTTIRTWNGDVQVMSDVWENATHVTYWDEDNQKLCTQTWVENVVLDATDTVLEKVKNYIYNREVERLTESAQAEAEKIRKGSVVEVISGRSGKGTRGKVVVEIERPYGMGWRSVQAKKIAIATSDATVKVVANNGKVYENFRDVVWAWARNCALVEVPEIDLESVKEGARSRTDREISQYVTFA
jgi:hypothetical protein